MNRCIQPFKANVEFCLRLDSPTANIEVPVAQNPPSVVPSSGDDPVVMDVPPGNSINTPIVALSQAIIERLTFTGVDVGDRFGGRPDDDFRIVAGNTVLLDAKRNVGDYSDPFFFEYTEGLQLGLTYEIYLFNGWQDAFTVPLDVRAELSDGDVIDFRILQQKTTLTELEPSPDPIPPGYFSEPQFFDYTLVATFTI